MLTGDLAIQLLDVLLYRQSKSKNHTAVRPFSALTFRLRSHGKYLYRGEEIKAETDEISFVPAGISYDRVTDDEEVIVFHFTMFNFPTDRIEVFHPKDPVPYRDLFFRALAVWKEKAVGYRAEATALFYKIIALLGRDGAWTQRVRDPVVADAASYMQEHFSDSALTIAELAKRACVSEAFFRRKFHAYYAMSPKRYLDEIRMRYALSLLQAGYFSQKEVAARCGYTDVKYFRTAFRRHTGQTPGDVRCSSGPL